MTERSLIHDSCMALLAEKLDNSNQIQTAQVHSAGWFAVGKEWLTLALPIVGKLPMLESDAKIAAYGMKPSDFEHSGVRPRPLVQELQDNRYNPSVTRSRMISHPLHLAIMFDKLLRDPMEAVYLFKEYDRYPSANSMCDTFWRATWTPPYYPQALNRVVSDTPKFADSISFIHWHNPRRVEETLADAVSQYPLVEAISTCVRLGVELNMTEPLRTILIQVWRQGTSITDLTDLIRLAPYGQAYRLIGEATGIKQALGIVRADTSEKLMIKGLRQIASYPNDAHRVAAAALYGRAPTVKELKAVRGAGLIDILYYMPWSILEPLVASNLTEIRALTFAHLSNLSGDKRYCLQNHEKRATLRFYAGRESGKPARVTGQTSETDWNKVFGGLALQHQRSTHARMSLMAECLDPAVAIVAALPAFNVDALNADRILRHHPNYTRIQEVAKTLVQPVFTADALAQLWADGQAEKMS